MADLPSIPLIDLRDSSLAALAAQRTDSARALLSASRDAFGIASRMASYAALPLGDFLSRRWLARTNNPYHTEIASYAESVARPGVYALNLSYEWGCTSGAYPDADSATLMRTMDWPFPALGENMVVTHQRAEAGEFYNVTWPGVSGVFQAMAPGRFAASLNQAPMRRYRTGIVADWIRNRHHMHRQHGLPPAHLLRQVFEMATNYAEAKRLLCETPVALPVIYILAGMSPEESCVIERLENHHALREGRGNPACAANHFETALNGTGAWSARPIDSHGRVGSACKLASTHFDRKFVWFTAPIANRYSRLAMVANAKTGRLDLLGTYGAAPVTDVFSLS